MQPNRRCFYSTIFLVCLASCEAQQKVDVVPTKIQATVATSQEPAPSPPPPSVSTIFKDGNEVAGATELANSGDEQSMALLEEHYKQINDVQSVLHWQDQLIEAGSTRAMVRKATLLSGLFGPESCAEVIALLEEAVAKSKNENERELASVRLAAMKGELDIRISCVNRSKIPGATK